jgi:nitric oxide reductase NorD protein
MRVPGTRLAGSAEARFVDCHRLLTLFAQGLAGEYLHLKLLEPMGASGSAGRIKPVGDSILLPPAIGDYSTIAHNLGAYRIAVLRQIGYRLEGTFDLDFQCFLSSWPRPKLLRHIFSIVEGLRIDATVRQRYPGARGDLDRVRAHALAQRSRRSATRQLAALLEALRRFSLGAQRSALLKDDESGLLACLFDAADVVLRPGAEVHDSARAALRICADLEVLFSRSFQPRPSAPEEVAAALSAATSNETAHGDSRGGESAELDLREEEVGGGELGFLGELDFNRMVDGRSGGQVGTSMGSQPPPSPELEQKPRIGVQPASPSRPATRPHTDDGARSFLYDEWDFRRQSYLPAWCRVFEHPLRGNDFGFIDDVRRRHSILVNQVRRQFGSIKPESWRRVRGSVDGDELELDSVIEAVIDRHAGHVNDSHVYVRRDRALRDVAAAFLVDMSASTDFPLPDPAAAAASAQPQTEDSGLYLYGGHDEAHNAATKEKRRVIDVSKEALALMCGALHTLGDSYAVYGFSGDGRANVEFHVAKDFADKLSARTWAALAAMQPRRSTRMGAAIRHAQSKLARETARIKLLIIISDGYPEDNDYGTDRNDREHGLQDTARALMEAERAGTVNFCVTIDPAGHDYLRRMCQESRYLVIDDVSALPRELTKVYRTLTVA